MLAKLRGGERFLPVEADEQLRKAMGGHAKALNPDGTLRKRFQKDLAVQDAWNSALSDLSIAPPEPAAAAPALPQAPRNFEQLRTANNEAYNAQSDQLNAPLNFNAQRTDSPGEIKALSPENQRGNDIGHVPFNGSMNNKDDVNDWASQQLLSDRQKAEAYNGQRNERFQSDANSVEKLRGMGYLPGTSYEQMRPNVRKYLADAVQNGSSSALEKHDPRLVASMQQAHNQYYPSQPAPTGKYFQGKPVAAAPNTAPSQAAPARPMEGNAPAPTWGEVPGLPSGMATTPPGPKTYNPTNPQIGQSYTAANGNTHTVIGKRPMGTPATGKQYVSLQGNAPKAPAPFKAPAPIKLPRSPMGKR